MTLPSFIGIQGVVLLTLLFILLFGVRRLPEAGRSLGRGLREFKQALMSADPRAEGARPRD